MLIVEQSPLLRWQGMSSMVVGVLAPCCCCLMQVVAELQQRTKQVAFEATALTSQRQQLAALDAQRRAALRAIEDSLATAGARLDDRAKEEKLKQIRLAEESYEVSHCRSRARAQYE